MPTKKELQERLNAADQRIHELETELASLRARNADAETCSRSEEEPSDARALKQDRDRLMAVIENSPASVVITDVDGTIVYVNPYFERLTGYSAEEALGSNPRILKAGNTQAHVYEDLWGTITQGRTWTGDLLNRRKNGSLFWERASITPLFDPKGEITHYAAIKIDITTRKQVEIDLTRTTYLLNETGRIANIGGWEYDLETGTPYVSEGTRRILEVPEGFTPALGVSINFFSGESRDRLSKAIEHGLQTGEGWDLELEIVTARGNHKWVRSIGESSKQDNTVTKIFGTLQDITATRKLKQEKRNLMHQLEERFLHLDLLHDVSIEAHRARSTEQFMQTIARMTPQAWNKSDCICARVSLGDLSAVSTHFSPAGVPVIRPIRTQSGETGSIEVFRRAGCREGEPRPFNKAEASLIESLAAMVELCLNTLQARDSLRLSTERYRHIMNSSRSVIFEVDADGVIHFVNRYAEEVFGFSRKEMLGHTLTDTILPKYDSDGNDLEVEIMDVIRDTGKTHDTPHENEVVTKSGKRLWFSWYNRPIFDAEGKLQTMVSVGIDTTERKRNQLETEQRQLVEQTLSELGKTLLGPSDINEISRQVLEAGKRLTGCRYGFVGAVDEETGHLTAHTMTHNIWEECQVPDKTFIFEKYCGLWGWVLDKAEPILTNHPVSDPRSGGTPKGHIPIDNFLSVPAVVDGRLLGQIALANTAGGFDRDHLSVVSRLATLFALALQRKRYEEEIKQAREQAEEASKAKSAFLTKVSHEVRTPMNSILGMTDVLMQSRLAPMQREYLRSVKNSGEVLLAIINDILDLSRIEKKRFALAPRPFLPKKLVKGVVDSMRGQADEAGLSLSLTYEKSIPECLVGDADRLRQVLINLVNNAIRFTQEGSITVSVSPVEPCEGNSVACRVRFNVTDTGSGIPEEIRDSILDRFSQGDDSLSRTHGGLGLGLAISVEIIQKMGGEMLIDSTPGAGSSFTFDILFEVGEMPAGFESSIAPPAISSLPEPTKRLSVLLADDNEDNKQVIKAFLDRIGHDLTVVNNGREALEALRRQHYDAVLMDVEMPVMNGIDATRHIRGGEAGEEASSTSIIAMTAHAQSGTKEECKEAGMDDYLTKPVSMRELAAALERVASRLPATLEDAGRLDTPSVMVHLGGDLSLLHDLYRIFIRTAPQRLDEIEEYLEEMDTEGAVRAAHSLKGNAATIGAGRLEERIARLHDHLILEEWSEARDILPGVRSSTLFIRDMLEKEMEQLSQNEPLSDNGQTSHH
ncbi:PAS domain-containing hybrid sensor histidine kinase/response regulator [Salidesulfovibrio brasiliensis]